MQPTRRQAIILGAGSAVSIVTGCGKKDSGGGGSGSGGMGGGDRVKVGVVTNNTHEFWKRCQAGAKVAGEKFNAEVLFRMPEKQDAGIQRDIINEMVQQGVSGVAVSVIDPINQKRDLTNTGRKVNLITMDNDADGTGRLTYIGTDNYVAGKAVGRLVKECYPDGGTVAIFVGSKTALNAQQRYQGVVDELAGTKDAKGPKFGKFTLYRNEPITDNGDAAQAKNNARDALVQLADTPNLCMVGLYAYNAPGILEAAKAAGIAQKIKIVSFDEYEQVLQAIQRDEIYGTVVQDPYNFGFKSVELLAGLARGSVKKDAVPDGTIAERIIVKQAAKDPVTGAQRVGAAEFLEELRKQLAGS